jgi:hypothetical protein
VADLVARPLDHALQRHHRVVDHADAVAEVLEALHSALLADDRELHDVGDAVPVERLGQQADEVVEEVAAPEVDLAVRGVLRRRVRRALVEACDDDVVALLRHPRVEVERLGRDAIRDAVAERVGQRVRHGGGLDVDGVDVRGPVAGELHGEQPGARADVQAALVRADALPVEVAPQQERAGIRPGDLWVDDEVGHVEREQRAAAVVAEARAVGPLALPQVHGRRRAGGAGDRAGERGARRLDVLHADAAAAPDDLRALLAPPERELGVLAAADRGLRAPAVRRERTQVGVHAQRQVGEVAQP